jgi:hypothetical protein
VDKVGIMEVRSQTSAVTVFFFAVIIESYQISDEPLLLSFSVHVILLLMWLMDTSPLICPVDLRVSKHQQIKLYFTYRVIHKSARDFRPLRYSNRDGHAEGEHVNRGRDTPSFCTTLQVLDMSNLVDKADVNPVIKFLPHTLQHLAVDSSDCLHDPSSQLW